MNGCPYAFLETHCEVGLWDAFHDGELDKFQLDDAQQTIKLELLACFPYPPANAAERIGLEFSGLRELKLMRWEPPEDEAPMGEEERSRWSARGTLHPYTFAEFEQAILEDSPARVAAAGASLSPQATFMMFVVFDNLPLALVVSIVAERLEVTADGRPSSLEEWMAWGTAGWEKFAGQSPPTGLSSWLTRLFRMGRPE